MNTDETDSMHLATQRLFDQRYARECARLSNFMVWLMIGQWIGGVLFALIVSPYTWIGDNYSIHVHVLAAIFLGGGLSGIAIWHLKTQPAAAFTRHVVAIIQLLWTCLLIHLTGGRVETHFHAFASLAILSLYRDWRIIVTATLVVALDHAIRGIWYPLSVFGTSATSPWRWIEHSGWVVFEVSFLIPGCIRLRKEIWELCQLQVQTDAAKTNVEQQVATRTKELASTVRELDSSLSKIADQRQFMETMIESVSGLFYVINEHGHFEMWNRQMEVLFDEPGDRLRDVPAIERFHPDDREYMVGKMEEVFRNGQAQAEARLITPSGVRYVVLAGHRVEVDDRVILVGSGQDISERRGFELELSEFRETLDKTHDCVFIFRPENLKFTYVNEGAARQVGYSREELLGMTPLDIKPDYDETSFRELIQPLLEGKTETCTFETYHQNRNASRIPVEVTLQFVRMASEEGKFVAIVRDITRRRQLEAARSALEEERLVLHRQLIESSRKAGMAEVASGVLHNVGNVLNSVNVSTNLLRDHLDKSSISSLERLVQLIESQGDQLPDFLRDDPRGRQVPVFLSKLSLTLRDEQKHLRTECQEILDNVEHIKEIVSMQQSLARVKAIASEIYPHDLMRQAHSAVRDSLIKHEIRFEQSIDDDLDVIISDKQRILQILINLITNAKDALLNVKSSDRTIHANVRKVGKNVIFAVVDNGDGISPEKMDQIFNFGFTTKVTGNGFGLHYCANAAVELGGKLTAHSLGLGHGATFELIMPSRPDVDATGPSPAVVLPDTIAANFVAEAI